MSQLNAEPFEVRLLSPIYCESLWCSIFYVLPDVLYRTGIVLYIGVFVLFLNWYFALANPTKSTMLLHVDQPMVSISL